jgi:hypothetical protein
MMRLLANDLPDLVEVEGSREEIAASALPAAGSGAGTFDGDLARLRRRVLRSWALASAGRCALVALAVAVIPAALAAAGAIGWVWAIIVPVVLFVVALAARLSRPPSTAAVARLLDDRLGLFDVTATALDAERSGAPVDEGPAAPVYAEAAALLHAGAERWKPRARFDRRGLGAAAGLVVILAVLVVVGSGSGNGGGAGAPAKKPVVAAAESSREQLEKEGHGNNVSPPLAPPRLPDRNARLDPNGTEHRSPLGLYVAGLEGKKPLPKIEGGRAPGTYSHGKSPGAKGAEAFAAKAPGEGNEAREKAEEEAAGRAKEEAEEASKSSGGPSNVPQRLKSLTGGKAAPGSVTPLPNGHSGAPPGGGRPGTGQNAPPPGKGSSGESAKGGAGAGGGGGGVGHQEAELGHQAEGREGGRTGGELKLKAGFSAARGKKAATGHGPRDAEGGGGPGRAAGIGGSGFEEAEAGSLGYVPPDAGVAANTDPGLFERYLEALTQISGQHW